MGGAKGLMRATASGATVGLTKGWNGHGSGSLKRRAELADGT
jgi:hypothetical protein